MPDEVRQEEEGYIVGPVEGKTNRVSRLATLFEKFPAEDLDRLYSLLDGLGETHRAGGGSLPDDYGVFRSAIGEAHEKAYTRDHPKPVQSQASGE